MRHPHYARTLAGYGRVNSAGQSLEVQSTEQAKCLGGMPSTASALTEQGPEYTFSGGYAKNPHLGGMIMTAVSTMTAKKKGPGRPKGPIRRETVLGLKGTPEWKTWLEEYAEFCRLSMVDTIDQDLAEGAKRKGFRSPPMR
jgi:hypothetical protein